MPENKKKKKWTTPLLTVLVRGKPEERVLAACKWDAGGPESGDTSCADLACVNCDAIAPS